MKKEALLIGYENISEVQIEGLDDLQKLVGGLIDVVDLPLFGENRRISLCVNDEGIYTCEVNRALVATEEMEEAGYVSMLDGRRPVHAGGYYSILWGPIVALGYDPLTGDSVSLTDEDKKAVVDYFSACRTGPGSGADLSFLMSLQAAI